jgi:aminopeptidase N
MIARLFSAVALAASPLSAEGSTVLGSAILPGSGFDVSSYTLSLAPDVAGGGVSGVEDIRLRSTQGDLDAVAFSANALTVTDAKIDGAPVVVETLGKAIVFRLPTPLAKGRAATLRLRFSGQPARGVTVLPGAIYTSYFACDWMICLQDSPGDRARFSLDLYLPKSASSLATGRQSGTSTTGDGRVVHRWRSTRDYSPFLFGFAAGTFGEKTMVHGGNTLTYLDATGTDADLEALFAETPAMIDFLSAKAGVPLPAGHFTQLLVPGGEAQEAATYALIGKGELDSEAGNPEAGWVIVHELTHQWWGNLVTCATWRDFWLNEGITTFMTAAWKEHRFGPAAYQAELEIARGRVARLRETGWDRPLAWDGAYPSLRERRAVQYSKGALFMDHLRSTLGEEAFWRGLRMFTTEHAGGTVTSADFQRAMEKASKRDLSPIFAEWVFGPG